MPRRRWVQEIDPKTGKGTLVEVPLDHIGRRRSMDLTDALVGDRHYDGLRATDGTPIDTRVRHREYMRRNGLTTADDFTETWKTHRRSEELRDNKARRESVERALHKLDPP